MTTYAPIVLNTYLIALLKQEGITVNAAAAIAIFKIIQRHQESQEGNFATLKYLITPILSRTREEQQKIYDLLDRLDEKFQQDLSLPDIAPPEKEILPPVTITQQLISKTSSFLRHHWIPVSLLLLLVAGGLWFYVERRIPFKEKLSVYFTPLAVIHEPVEFIARINDTTDLSVYQIHWLIGHQRDSAQWTMQKTFDSAGVQPILVYLLKERALIDSFKGELIINCEPKPAVSIRELQSTVTAFTASKKNVVQLTKSKKNQPVNLSTGKRRKWYEPVFQHPSRDSLKYAYQWYVNGVLTGTNKVFSYVKSEGEYHIIRLLVNCQGTHCSTDTLGAQYRENKAIAYAHTPDVSPLMLPTNWDIRNLLTGLLFLLVVPAVIAGAIYYFRKKLWFRTPPTTKWEKDLPYTFTFPDAQHLIHPATGIRLLTDILRKRQVSASRRVDVPRTIQLSMRSWGVPQLAFQQGSAASEYLILMDNEQAEGHLIQLYSYLCQQLQKEQVNIIVYDYYKQPLLLNSSTLQHQLIPTERLAALYPGATLIVFGQSTHFISPVKNALKPWVIEKFRHWDKKIFITGYGSDDWDKKESLLAQAGFFVLPADLSALSLMESYLFDVEMNKRLFIPRAYPSRFVQLDTVDDLRYYFREQPLLFQWVCALAIYPVPVWAVTLRIGHTLEQYYKQENVTEKIVTYTNLLKLSRISWMQSGNWNESLKASLLTQLDKDVEAAVRQSLNEDISSMIDTLPDGSVAKEELKTYHRLNAFLLDAFAQKPPSLKNAVAIDAILKRDQVDAAHKMYLDHAPHTILQGPHSPQQPINTATYMRKAQRPARRRLLTEALMIVTVLSLLTYIVLNVQQPALLKWRKVLPVTKSLTLIQQLPQPQVLYADVMIGNRQEQIAFTGDTIVTFAQLQLRDTSEQLYFHLTADPFARREYDSFPLHSFNDTLFISEPPVIPVTLISGDPFGSVLADSLEQALPSNFTVSRLQSPQSDTGIVIRYSDTGLRNSVQSLNAIILRLFNETGTTSLLTALPPPPGIRVFLGDRNVPVVNPPLPNVIRDTTRNNNIELPPVITRTAGWYFDQGQAMYQQGLYAESIRYYDSSIQLNPKDPIAYYNRGLGHEQLREFSAATSDFQVAININPNDALSNFRMAEIEFNQREYTTAIANYSRVITINSSYITTTNFIAYYKRGEAYRLTNNLANACVDYQFAADGGNQEARAALKSYCKKDTIVTSPSNQNILLVGTDPSLIQSVRTRLQSYDYRLTVLTDVNEATKYLSEYASSLNAIIYIVDDVADEKRATQLVRIQQRYSLPLIVFYYRSKEPSSNIFSKRDNIYIVTSEAEIPRTLDALPERRNNIPQQQQQQAK